MIPYVYAAKIIYVTDGDTCDALIDVGFKLTTVQRIRLLGVDTHEMHDKSTKNRDIAQAAKDWLSFELLNRDVIIHTQKTDAFGRYLADIYLGSRHINEEIKQKGFCK